MMPSKHRGWSLVLVGGLGSVGGYFAASGFSALLQPEFGWRILWLLNLPTGLALVLLGAFIPESAKFLLARGRREEARRVMERFGSQVRSTRPAEAIALSRSPTVALTGRAFFGKLFALSLAAICYGLINFGLLLWLPTDLGPDGTHPSPAGRAKVGLLLLDFFKQSDLAQCWFLAGHRCRLD